MNRVYKTKTWADNWNDVIRYVLFKDTELRRLMMLPPDTTIVQFIEQYFVEDPSPDEVMTDENVRIAVYDTKGTGTGNRNVRLKYKEFDIYVKRDHLHDATRDRLQNRGELIARRLKYLLMKYYHVCRLHFEFEDEYELWTKMTGYKRYHVAFAYKISV